MKVALPTLLSSALALSVGFAAQASEPPAADNAASTQNDVVVGIDPTTGKLRQLSDAEIQSLSDKANSMSRSARAAGTEPNAAWARMPQNSAQAEQTIRTHANGMSSAELPISAMNSLSVERDADGKVQVLENGAPASHGQQEVLK